VRVLLADDHVLLLEALTACLESDPSIKVTTADSLDQAIAEVEAGGAFDLHILDYNMPGMYGLAGLSRMLRANENRPTALMSGTVERHIIDRALELGAIGFIPKTMSTSSMISAVHFMSRNEKYVPVGVYQLVEEEDIGFKLSPRETEVLKNLAQGMPNKEIANIMNIEETTVKVHVKKILHKLDVKNRTHAAIKAKELMLF